MTPSPSPLRSPWRAACAALALAAVLSLFLAPPVGRIGPQASALLHLWVALSWLGGAWRALGPAREGPPWMSPSADIWRHAALSAVLRVLGVYLLGGFLGAGLGVPGALAGGVGLALLELSGEQLAAWLVERPPARARAFLRGYVALLGLAAVGSSVAAGMLPSHWLAGALYALSGPAWWLFPPALLASSLVGQLGALVPSLGAAVALGLLAVGAFSWRRAPRLFAGLALGAGLLGGLGLAVLGDSSRREEEAGRLAAQAPARGIVGRPAPELLVSQYVGERPPRLADHAGKVRALYFFQRYCPGCVTWGFPTTKKVEDAFPHHNFQAFFLQTTFDLEEYNTFEAARAEVESWALRGPFGQDASVNGDPQTMQRYHARGTPWTTLIDKRGIVRFSGPTPSFAFQKGLIDALLAE